MILHKQNKIRQWGHILSIFDLILMGLGLAMDAACVTATNSIAYKTEKNLNIKIATVFAIYQGVMPMIGYFVVGTYSEKLFAYNHIIGLVLLSAIGINMIYSSVTSKEEYKVNTLTLWVLLMQWLSTSLDALCVGVTLNHQSVEGIAKASGIIALVTFVIVLVAWNVGKKIGTKLNNKAEIFGGCVLILLGVKIFIEGI